MATPKTRPFVLLALTSALLFAAPAQADSWDSLPALTRDCSARSDPAACEDRKERLRSAITAARKTCRSARGEAHAECMGRDICSKASDPRECEASLRQAQRMADRTRN
jgi:hypothetical protein